MATKTEAKTTAKAAKKAPAKKFDKEKAKQWGSPDYLMMRFADIQDVEEMSRWCADTKRVKEAVKGIATLDDHLGVHKVYRATVEVPGDEVENKSTVVHITLGLNGNGSQAAYFAALQRLVETGSFHVFDISVDSLDDLVDVLCTYTAPVAKAAKKGKSGKKGA